MVSNCFQFKISSTQYGLLGAISPHWHGIGNAVDERSIAAQEKQGETANNRDYSPEKQQIVAEHFEVSEMTIRTQLVNHHVLDRERLDTEDFALAA